MADPAPLTKPERRALRLLLAQGGARYGTQHDAMASLRDRGLAYACDRGNRGMVVHRGRMVGRWTWRPTPLAREQGGTLCR